MADTKPSTSEDYDVIDVFTDGSCLHNGNQDNKKENRAGWAVLWPRTTAYRYGRVLGLQESGAAEWHAIVEAVVEAKNKNWHIRVCTDYKSLEEAYKEKLFEVWKANKYWKRCKAGEPEKRMVYADYYQKVEPYLSVVKAVRHVKSHQKVKNYYTICNTAVDGLARIGANKLEDYCEYRTEEMNTSIEAKVLFTEAAICVEDLDGTLVSSHDCGSFSLKKENKRTISIKADEHKHSSSITFKVNDTADLYVTGPESDGYGKLIEDIIQKCSDWIHSNMNSIRDTVDSDINTINELAARMFSVVRDYINIPADNVGSADNSVSTRTMNERVAGVGEIVRDVIGDHEDGRADINIGRDVNESNETPETLDYNVGNDGDIEGNAEDPVRGTHTVSNMAESAVDTFPTDEDSGSVSSDADLNHSIVNAVNWDNNARSMDGILNRNTGDRVHGIGSYIDVIDENVSTIDARNREIVRYQQRLQQIKRQFLAHHSQRHKHQHRQQRQHRNQRQQ